MAKKPTNKAIRELMERVKRAIRRNHGRYYQSDFCGSACCIAGWIDILENGLEAHNRKGPLDVREFAYSRVGRVPGRTADWEKVWLFGPASPWPNPLQQDYYNATTTKERAEVGCAAIDEYLAERRIK